jgi:acyl transferase domain-containing protein/surfactin synthase thioesterase subunit
MKSAHSSISQDSIAIIGMSCRFPKSNSLLDFWELLKDGKDTITEIPKERWDAHRYYDPDPQAERKTHQQHASLLSDIHDFDPLFFNISPAEANEMSPSQKLMLELAWEAIENSTLSFNDIKGTNTSVFVGNIWTDFEHYRKTKNARVTLHSALGMSANVVANRVSFALGFTGPSLVIDTGCSASLVALHLACKALLNNESAMSMVGGVNHILDPDRYIDLTQFGALSAKGRCSTFDADADGFVRGEGGSMLLLKKLSEAERDGNKIYAVIRGTAVNNNGYNDTLAATNTEGQKSLFEKVYSSAGIRPEEVHYIEAHGTGTKAGDPVEAVAIGEFFGKNRNGNRLRVGSVKSNIGHTEAAAGIAGLVKVVLAMQHRTLPPNLHFNNPNPNIPFEELKLEVQKNLSPWPLKNGETFKAGINSFGWGGTNAHVAVEEYRADKKGTGIISGPAPEICCLPLSAKSSPALKDYARAYAREIENGDEKSLKALCIATALRKPEFDHRVLPSGSSREQMLVSLRNFIGDESEVIPFNPVAKNARVVFVFPGQGGQWIGMGRELLVKEKVFRDSILACDAAFRELTDWSLTDQIMAAPETSRLDEINVIQPAICAIQIALAKLWMSWGIRPQAVVGHSMGEVAAAYIAGALTLEDAARVICGRSLLMKTVSGKGGAMAVTELSREDAGKIAAGYGGRLSVAVNNSHKSTVLAGDKASIGEVLAQLEAKGIFCRLVKVDVASHSPQMDPLKEPLRRQLQSIRPQKTAIPLISTVYGKVMQGADMDADYWVDNLRGTVRFASAMDLLMQDGHTVFIEANPHPVLINAVTDCAEYNRKKVIAVASLQRDNTELEAMLKNLGDLYSKGYPVNWQDFYGTSQAPDVALPLYPFQRERYEIEDRSKQLEAGRDLAAKYPLLGNKIHLASNDDTYYWKSVISLHKFPYLRDHHILDNIVLPVSCYIEMIFEAVSDLFDKIPIQIGDLDFTNDITLSDQEHVEIQVKLVIDESKKGQVHIFKKEDHESGWVRLAQGNVLFDTETPRAPETFEQIGYHVPAYPESISYYNLLRSIGLNYGKQFQMLTGLAKAGNQPFQKVSFTVKADPDIHLSANKYRVHPALMNNFFHPVFSQLMHILEEGTLLDVKFNHIGKVGLYSDINYNHELRGLLVFHPLTKSERKPDSWHFNADITIVGHDNSPVMILSGVRGTVEKRKPEAGGNGRKAHALSFLENYATIKTESDREHALEQMITHHVSKVIGIAPNRTRNTMTFKGMGLDSLMAIQLRNLLEKDLLVKFAVGMFWSHPSIQDYALYLKDILAGQINGIAENKLQSDQDVNNWVTIPKPNPDASFRIFCFHDAGGSALLFNGWENLLDGSLAELVLLEMPGRGRRLEETPYVDFKLLMLDMVPFIAGLLDKPYIFLGHSMGGVLAYEITRELRRKKLALPETLFLSSVPEMGVYENKKIDFDKLPDQELVLMYPHLGNIGDEGIRRLFVDILRADLRLLYNYEFIGEGPLNIPIVAIHGVLDERVSEHQMEQWETQTTAAFQLISRQGGHRYIEHDGAFVAQLLQEEIYSKTQQEPKIHI